MQLSCDNKFDDHSNREAIVASLIPLRADGELKTKS